VGVEGHRHTGGTVGVMGHRHTGGTVGVVGHRHTGGIFAAPRLPKYFIMIPQFVASKKISVRFGGGG